ncbi:MAG TPA: hypothetical protein VIY47_08375 [Ignavibacteriaceae bacterium]
MATYTYVLSDHMVPITTFVDVELAGVVNFVITTVFAFNAYAFCNATFDAEFVRRDVNVTEYVLTIPFALWLATRMVLLVGPVNAG